MREEAGNPPEYHVGRVFCDHQTLAGLEDYMDIVMSLWSQLVDSMGGLMIPTKVLKEWESKLQMVLSRRSEVELKMQVLNYTISQAGKTLFILDGLDEVLYDHQKDLIEILRGIQRSNQQCRLMITTRPYGSITALRTGEPKLELRATAHDIELYIRDRISRSSSHFLNDHGITATIIRKLREKCDGTFLMAKLHMDEVLKADSASDCLSIIENLPTEASQAYETGLKRLSEDSLKPEGDIPCRPIQALFWVAYAKAPMTAKQLKQALAVELTDITYKRQNEIEKGIDKLCGELLIVDPSTQEVRVAHKTITDYLMKPATRETWFPNIQEHIHLTLIRYLSLTDLNEAIDDPQSIEQFRDRHPLLPYAFEYWGEGISKFLDISKPSSAIWQATERFLMSSHHEWNRLVQVLLARTIRLNSQARFQSRFREAGCVDQENLATIGQMRGLHWAVIFSIDPFVRILCERESTTCHDGMAVDIVQGEMGIRRESR